MIWTVLPSIPWIQEGRLRAAFFFWRIAQGFARKDLVPIQSRPIRFHRHRPVPSCEEIHMRAILFSLVGLMTVSTDLAYGQMKPLPKAAPGANEIRYFTSIDGLMDGNADVILKETRQGKTVTAAMLDVCYPVAKNTDR